MVGFARLTVFVTTFLLPVLVVHGAWAVPLQPGNCDSGSEPDGKGSCRACAVGYYRQAGSNPECTACPEGMITQEVGAWMKEECDLPVGARGDCPSGQQWTSTGERCALCPAGTYRTKSVDYWCIACPRGQNTSLPGAVSIDDCVVPVQCVAGTEWNQTTLNCEPCKRNYFRPRGLGMRCNQCPPGHVTMFRGSRSSSECVPYGGRDLVVDKEDCPAGTQYDAVLHVCSVCGVGFYRAASDPFTSCQPCAEGSSTPTEGATHHTLCLGRERLVQAQKNAPRTAIDCPLGSEWFELKEPFWGLLDGCRPCPWDTFRDQRRQHLCAYCPLETSTLMIGAISRRLCVNSTVGEATGNGEGGGSFSPDTCPPGTWWNLTLVACLVCPQGTYGMSGATCTACPANTTTLRRGAHSPEQCNIPKFTTGQPFFTESECPMGSEWDLFSRACRPCPRGWFRESHETTTCESCPAGLSTLNAGSMSAFLCAVPQQVPDRIVIGSDGCDPGYRDAANRTYCVPCARGSYKSPVGFGVCTPCPTGRDGTPLQTSQRGASDVTHCLPTGHVTRVTPGEGPQAGGTLLQVEVDAPIDFRVAGISVGSLPCKLTANYLVDGVVRCVTPAVRRLPPPGPVSLRAAGGLLLTSSSTFTYGPDPSITELSRVTSIVSGGLTLTVTGQNLKSVSAPALLLSKTNPSMSALDNLRWPCESQTPEVMHCPLPDMSELLASPTPRRRRSDPDANTWLSLPVRFHTGFALDGVTYFRNLSHVLPQYGTFVLHPDPQVTLFKDSPKVIRVQDTKLEIKGRNLDLALTVADYRVDVGRCSAPITSLTDNTLSTTLCQGIVSNIRHKITVSMAGLSVYVGDVMLMTSVPAVAESRTSEALRIVIPLLVVAAVVILLIIIITTVYLYRKRSDKNMDYSPDSSMMATAAQNGHVVDPRLPPLPVNSVFGPERVTVMPGTQGFTTVRSKRDRGVSMRQLALPLGGGGGGHAGMSVVEAVEIGNQDLLRFERDKEDLNHSVTSSVHHSDVSSVQKERPGVHFRWI